MSLADRLLKVAKTNEYASILTDSKVMDCPILATTDVPMLNVALSGELDGGVYPGIKQLVGDSRTFKTCYALLMMASFLKQNPDGMALFFDSELGAAFQYFDTFGIDKDKVLHLPIEDIEDLKIQCKQQLNEITEKDKVFIFIDSLGLLPSRKELEDAENANTVADMTRARAMNSFWRVVTIPLGLKKVPMVAVNHYYDTMAKYPEKIIKGGKGGFLASNDIWLITRSKIAEGRELQGWTFNIKIMKSRTVRENAVIPVMVRYDNGIDRTSGLLEVARATGFVVMPTNGWYQRTGVDDNNDDNFKFRKSALTMEWWQPVLDNEDFQEAVRDMYTLAGNQIFDETKLEGIIAEDDE